MVIQNVNDNKINSKLERFKAGLYYADSTKELYTSIARKLLLNPIDVLSNIKSKSKWRQVKVVVNRLNELRLTKIDLPNWQKKEDSRANYIKKRNINDELFETILYELPKTQQGEELKLACLLSYTMGARLEEVLSISSKNVKFNSKIEISIIGKSNLSRTTYVLTKNKEIKKDLETQLKSFITFTISANYVKTTLNRISKRIGFNFSFYDFRHAFAIRVNNEGIPIMGIKNLLGHKDRKTTMVYLDMSMDETNAPD